ncbi:methyl-accepting chemotaxis protein [Pseudoalteromonas phenolica]|uniref:Methyl-accepting chemotaxis protein n=1 Tax=Pseudoalteromonas phenolica TaxID=161398 RepID=A0A5R9Q7D6_9GAMM|nr:methyl-accepting chemotaxis protein [Pseudoalteromonas phenolica]TLX48885.1 methyl-accepting chemotaxis protein [Pseudoalteromonas phenolica]
MRVSAFTRWLAILLTSASLFLAGVLFWASNLLNTLDQQNTGYNQLKNTVLVELSGSIESYLSSGDSQYLTESSDIINKLKQAYIGQLPDELAATMGNKLDALDADINGKYRAIGKLSGNEMALLDNALRQMSGSASSLISYASKADDSPVKKQYYELASDYFQAVNQLSIFTYHLSINPDANTQTSLQNTISTLQSIANKIERLENLGVMSEVDEDALFFGEEVEDLADEIKSELSSWANRFGKDVQNTFAQSQSRQAGTKALRADIQTIIDIVLSAESDLKVSQDDLKLNVLVLFSVAIGLLILLAAGVYFVQLNQVLNPLRQLRDGFADLINSNEMKQIHSKNPDTEVGEIAGYFNQLIQRQQLEAQERQEMLTLVNEFMAQMSESLSQISQQSENTYNQVEQTQGLLHNIRDLGEQANDINTQVSDNANSTFEAMSHSVQFADAMLEASSSTEQRVEQGQDSLNELLKGVSDVGTVVEMIRTIAEQTNLLALNAAIESARAGEHGRGFAVVADEVRKLAQQTQDSLSDIHQQLNTLGENSKKVSEQMGALSQDAQAQTEHAQELKRNSEGVAESAQTANQVASHAMELAQQQSGLVDDFSQAMLSMKDQVNSSSQQVSEIQSKLQQQMLQVRQSLGLS